MEETYQLIEGSPTLRDLDAENGFLWCPFGHSGRQNEPGILISRLDDGSYDVRLGTGFDSPIRFAIRDLEWSWMDMAMEETVELTFADDMALNDWIASETTATGTAWARCFNPYCGPDEKTLNTSEIIDTLRRFESPSYIVRGPIEDIESLPVGYYWCPDALDPDPSYNGYLLNVFAAFGGDGLPGKFFELFGGVTLNDVPSFGFDDGWDGSCLNRLDWFEDAAGMDADGLSAGLVANDAESIKALIGNCPAWIECFPSYSEKAAKGVDDAVQAVKAYRLEGKRVHREVIPGYLYETAKAAAAKTRRRGRWRHRAPYLGRRSAWTTSPVNPTSPPSRISISPARREPSSSSGAATRPPAASARTALPSCSPWAHPEAISSGAASPATASSRC